MRSPPVSPYSIFASNGSDLRDSSKNNWDNPTPYASTVVITKEERNTPVITAKPLLSSPSTLCSKSEFTWEFEHPVIKSSKSRASYTEI